MPTATAQKPSAQLAKLERAAEKAHAPARELKRKRQHWADETRGLQARFSVRRQTNPDEFEGGVNGTPKAGTDTAKLLAEIKQRMDSENPFDADYAKAVTEFHVHDEALQDFKRRNVGDLVEEVQGDARQAVEEIKDALTTLRTGCERYRVPIEEVRAIVLDTPGLNGQHYGYDARVDDLYNLALGLVDAEFSLPGLSQLGEAKAAAHV